MTRRITYPLPLRDDFDAMLELPIDLTAAEAERVAIYVRSLAVTSDEPDQSNRPRQWGYGPKPAEEARP